MAGAELASVGTTLLLHRHSKLPIFQICLMTILVLFLGGLVAFIAIEDRTLKAVAARSWLLEFGSPARATVQSIVFQQEFIGANPVVRTTVRLSPAAGGSVLEASRKMYLSAVTVPWIGGELAAYYDPADPDCFTLVTALDDETPPRVRELHERILAEQDVPVVAPPKPWYGLIPVVTQLALLEQQLRDGSLTREEWIEKQSWLRQEHFPD